MKWFGRMKWTSQFGSYADTKGYHCVCGETFDLYRHGMRNPDIEMAARFHHDNCSARIAFDKTALERIRK